MGDMLGKIQSKATKRLFKKRSILLYQGEAPRMAYVLKSGVVKVYTINNAGEEQIVAFHAKNDIFPSSWIFGKSATTLYYFEALTDCEVLTMPREELHKHLTSNPEQMAAALDYFVTNYTGMMMRVTALEQSRAREKIMFTLYYLLFRYGRPTKGGRYVIELGLTHSIIASLVGLTRETTTTELSKLKRQKVLDYNLHSYTVHKEKLERILGEDSFQDVIIR
jgi:CRP/FNR family transcriptional regulator, cyclic AMP receptor protein